MRSDSSMTIPRIRRLLAFGFFSVWLAILSAGADHAIWFAVLAGVGIANSMLSYFFAWLFSRSS